MPIIDFLVANTEPTSVFQAVLNPDSLIRSAIELLAAIIPIVGAVVGIIAGIKKFKEKILAPHRVYVRYVDRVYSKNNRKEITKYYIPTRAQDIDPCDQDEIRDNNGKFISEPLVPFFRKEAFRESSQGKYYLVLADSGMGKTTFLLRLYRECFLKRSSKNYKNIQMIPLSQENCLNTIEKINNPGETILLLDALDENKQAIINYELFFLDLLRVTEEFNKVVITCRTQFFPNRASEPEMTGRIRIGTGAKSEEIVKKYISPFTDEEVKLYLKKRFRFKKRAQRKAYRIVKTVPALMARPIILNWINFLCDYPEEYVYTFQIYDSIIQKWIERENYGGMNKKLFEFSCAISEYMLSAEATSMSAEMVEKIAKQKYINLEPIIAKSRSLLNRNSTGEYKFAHRSFLEFFIVVGIFAKMQLPPNVDFLFGLSGAKRFFFEILIEAAERANSDCVNVVEQGLLQYRRHLEFENIFDFLLSKKNKIRDTDIEKGFVVDTYVELMKYEAYEPDSLISTENGLILAAKKKRFSSGGGVDVEIFGKDDFIKIGIKFTVQLQENDTCPFVSMEFYDVSHSAHTNKYPSQ